MRLSIVGPGLWTQLKQRVTSILRPRVFNTMEVTSSNFAEQLHAVERAIDDAVFLAIDGEFTGLDCENNSLSAMDTPAERYAKVRQSTQRFLMVQFGLCTFHYEASSKQYSNQAFNFYIWPKPFSKSAPNLRFLCQTSSISFLSDQNFDFNKLFKEGVPYLRPDDEQKLRRTIASRQEIRKAHMTQVTGSPMPDIPIPSEQEEFVRSVVKKVQAWLGDPDRNDKPLEIEKCNPFQRKLIYMALQNKFGPSISTETVMGKDKDRALVVSKSDPEQLRLKHTEWDQQKMEALNDAVGFTKVIRKISQSNKVVVGHNLVMDLCFTLNQFVELLPEQYGDFKALAAQTFPMICDTKLMASTAPFREEVLSSSLEDLLKAISVTKPYVIPEMINSASKPGYSLFDGQREKYHEAGYDAFITGLCFIAMANRLGLVAKREGPVFPDSDLVKPFMNKLFMMRVADVPYMNLSGEDMVPKRDHVFHVTFPAEWKLSDLQQLFSPFGFVQVCWISDTEAYVSLKDTAYVDVALVTRTLNHSLSYHIVPYHQYKSVSLTSGITPTLERASLCIAAAVPRRSFTSDHSQVAQVQASGKRRNSSPAVKQLKRNKSAEVREDAECKNLEKATVNSHSATTFQEPPWE